MKKEKKWKNKPPPTSLRPYPSLRPFKILQKLVTYMNSLIKKYLPRCLATQSFLLGSSPASADSCDDESERAGDAVHERASKNRSRRHIYWHYQKGTPQKNQKKKQEQKKTHPNNLYFDRSSYLELNFWCPSSPLPSPPLSPPL